MCRVVAEAERGGEAGQVQATLQAAGRDQMKHLPSWNKAALLKIHTHTLVSGQPTDTLLQPTVPKLLDGRSTRMRTSTHWNLLQLKRQHLVREQTNGRNASSSLAAVRVKSCSRLPFAARGSPVGTLIWFLAGCDMRKRPVSRPRAEVLQVQHKVDIANQFDRSH